MAFVAPVLKKNYDLYATVSTSNDKMAPRQLKKKISVVNTTDKQHIISELVTDVENI